MPFDNMHETLPHRLPETAPPVSEVELEPYQQVEIDLQAPLIDRDEVDQAFGIKGDIVAIVATGDQKEFLVVDTRSTNVNKDFLVIDHTFSAYDQERTGYKGLSSGETVTFGRNHHKDRFSYPNTVSGDHFEVSYDQSGLYVGNLRPTNKTTVVAHIPSEQILEDNQPEAHVYDGRTVLAQERQRHMPDFRDQDTAAPYGYTGKHPILGRKSTSVDNGVYYGGSAREAIVVDGESAILQQTYQSFARELKFSVQNKETIVPQAILLGVMDTVKDVMNYNEARVEAISAPYHGDKLVNLSTFIQKGVGVCRHQGLLAAYMVENLISDGYMTGTVGIERNTVAGKGTHAWGIYRPGDNQRGETIVIDPAQSFVGTKAQAKAEGAWPYDLSSDMR